jgi:MOSC domain-containing protein YiiM
VLDIRRFLKSTVDKKVAARLLSLNVGLRKAPVQGPRILRRLNIDGDGHRDLTGHGGEHRAAFVTKSTRVACYRVGIRLSEPQMPTQLH